MTENQDSVTTMSGLAGQIHETRISLDWSQQDLAEQAGVSRPTIARIERGDDVSTASLAKVATALGLIVTLNEARDSDALIRDVSGS